MRRVGSGIRRRSRPGSQVWLADSSNGVYGGVYTFENGSALEAFLGSELFAQVGAMPALKDITVQRFSVLSA